MTIYVDDAHIPATIGRYKAHWSHLVTDSPDIDELHCFAEAIGLKLAWFQEFTKVGHLYRPHYDVTDGKRAEAIQAGATRISMREMSDVLRRARDAKRKQG